MPILLAIDTSGATASVAVYDGQVLAETTWAGGRGHSRYLLRTIAETLELAGRSKGDLSVIAIASGPGSYSGLRVGATTAMGIGLGLGIGVIQIPTLEALAHGVGPVRQPVRATSPVGRGRFASACFRLEAGRRVQEAYAVQEDLDQTCKLASAEGALLVVNGEPSLRERASQMLELPAALAPSALSFCRASVVAELANARLEDGEAPVAVVSQLIYLGS